MVHRKLLPALLPLLTVFAACGDPEGPAPDVHVDDAIYTGLAAGDSVTAVIELTHTNSLPHGVSLERSFKATGQGVVTLANVEELDRLVSSGAVRAVHENVYVYPSGIADGLQLINQPVAVERGYTGAGRTVAVLDTGLDWTHSHFGDCTAPGSTGCRVLAARDFAEEDNELDSSIRHGTNVAGIVATVAPDAGILGLDVFDGDRASAADIIAAVDWVISNRDVYDVAAINMSLGTDSTYGDSCDQSVFSAPIQAALAAGIVTVVSSGNGGNDDAVSSPGCVSDAVTVGAIHGADASIMRTSVCEQTDIAAGDVACFSNSSDQIDLLAPGVSVEAAGVRMSGTSQAAPHVAAGVAIVAAMSDPAHGPEQWTDKLVGTARALVDYRNSKTFGMIELDAATVVADEPAEDVDPDEPVEDVQPEEPAEEIEPDEPADDVEPEEPADDVEPDEPADDVDPDEPADDVEPDEPEAPTAEGISVSINGGDSATSTLDVTLTIDDETPTQICISNTTSCNQWREFTPTVDWTLEPGAGSKTVTVWFLRPGVTVGAARASDTIYLR